MCSYPTWFCGTRLPHIPTDAHPSPPEPTTPLFRSGGGWGFVLLLVVAILTDYKILPAAAEYANRRHTLYISPVLLAKDMRTTTTWRPSQSPGQNQRTRAIIIFLWHYFWALAETERSSRTCTEKYRLQIRGTSGEHSEAKDGVHDISNQRRMGLTEYEIIKEMHDGIRTLRTWIPTATSSFPLASAAVEP